MHKPLFCGINCTASSLIIIYLLSCSGLTCFGGGKKHIDNDEFWKFPVFVRLQHDGFRGINRSVFFRTFISCWRLFIGSHPSLSGSISLEIDEMRVHLCLKNILGAMTGLFFLQRQIGSRLYLNPSLSTLLYQV
jgi:hypothetical protein